MDCVEKSELCDRCTEALALLVRAAEAKRSSDDGCTLCHDVYYETWSKAAVEAIVERGGWKEGQTIYGWSAAMAELKALHMSRATQQYVGYMSIADLRAPAPGVFLTLRVELCLFEPPI